MLQGSYVIVRNVEFAQINEILEEGIEREYLGGFEEDGSDAEGVALEQRFPLHALGLVVSRVQILIDALEDILVAVEVES